MKCSVTIALFVFKSITAFYLSENQEANIGRTRLPNMKSSYMDSQYRDADLDIPDFKELFSDAKDDEMDNMNKEIQRYLTGSEHALLRKTLQTAIRILDSENDYFALTETENPFYLEHILSLIKTDGNKNRKRNHKRRNAFDSIAHQGGLSGFKGYGAAANRQGKRPFTFQELLPYLLNEMRRNSRDVRAKS